MAVIYKPYQMVKSVGESSFIEKKSEFIGSASPVYTEEEALRFISSVKKKHYSANHNCFAYILGDDSRTQRSSDDGEPSGTAGLPILTVLRKSGLTNTVIVVTRYFGGILLGSGGLIRAYTEGASVAVKAAAIVTVQPMAIYYVEIDYSNLGKFQYEFPRKDYLLSNTEYTDKVTLTNLILPARREEFESDIMTWSGGSAIIIDGGIETIKIDVL